MKTKFFTLLMALLAFVWSAKAAEITSLRLTLSMNGGETFTEMIPASGFEELLLGGYITSLKIHKAEVTTSGTFTDMKFKATMYKTANGGPESDAEWQEVGFVDVGDGNWMIDIPGGRDLVDGSWDNKFKTFEFYIQGKDNSGNDVFYNNGGEDYKVTFSTGSGGTLINKIQFLEESTADLFLNVGGEGRSYSFNGDGSRTPEDQLGELSSLCIDQFALLFKTAEGVSTDDVSLQYRIYEDGEEPSGSWNGIGATHLDHQGDNQMFCYTDMMGRNVTNDLEPNKSYVLEVNYQVVVDGEYFFLGKNKEGSKFRFFLTENTSQEEIYSVRLTLSHNGGEPFEMYFDHENAVPLNLEGQTTSLKIMKAEVWTSDGIRSVEVFGTMYDTENGGPSGSNEWRAMPLNPSGSGYWMLEFGKEGYEIIEEEWLSNYKSKTFQFYVKGQDGSGNDVFYNNGGKDYKVNFTIGGGGDIGINSMKLTISHNGGPALTQEFPSSGWEELVLGGQTTSLIISKVEVQTSGSMQTVMLQGTIYNTSQGGPSGSNKWRSMPLENKGNGKWELDMGEGIDLIEADWLNENKSKTFEFYVQAYNGSSSQFFYDNGGAHYKVTFSTGEGSSDKIQFQEGRTAELSLASNNGWYGYAYDKEGNRDPSDQPGQLSSLTIEQFALWFKTADGVKTNDVSLQYRVYEEGQETEGGWNRIDAQQIMDVGSNIVYCEANGIGVDVTSGLIQGRNYVLEVYYQVVVDGEYYVFGKDKEDCKFRFTIDDGSVQTEGIRSMTLTINCDGEVFTESFPSEGWEIHAIEGLVSSIKVMRVEVESSESLTYMGFCSTIYNTADGWQHDDTAWDWIPMENQGGGHWVLDWGEGKEFIASEWLNQNVAKTLEFFADGGDANGNKYKYANGISNYGYDNNYKVTFTPGVDPDGISLVSASKENGATYNLAGQRVRKDYKGIVITNGRKVLIK